MHPKNNLRFSSVNFFLLSFAIRWVYNLSVLFYHHFTMMEKATLHLLIAVGSLVLGWLALRLYLKAAPTGSNFGCLYLFFLILNIIGGLGAVFFGMVELFSEQGNGSQTLWLL